MSSHVVVHRSSRWAFAMEFKGGRVLMVSAVNQEVGDLLFVYYFDLQSPR